MLSLPAPPLAPTRPPATLTHHPEVAVIDCLLTKHLRVPRSHLAGGTAANGRSLLRQAAATLRHVDVSHELLVDEEHRWLWPSLDLHGSVSHVDRWSLTGISSAGFLGVDIQDHRERPGALAFIGDLVAKGEPATIVEFAECESIVKATELTKDTFAHVRLPAWRPGWRQMGIGYWLFSADLYGIGAIALTSQRPAPIRWWLSQSSHYGTFDTPRPIACPVDGVDACPVDGIDACPVDGVDACL